MIQEIKFENYRCFKEFTLKDLKRVNLLVGKNSAGKTSILEGLSVLKNPGSLQTIFNILADRTEYLDSKKDIFSIDGFFFGYEATITKQKISINSKNYDSSEKESFVSYIAKSVKLSEQSNIKEIDSPVVISLQPYFWDLEWDSLIGKAYGEIRIDSFGGVEGKKLNTQRPYDSNCKYLPSLSFHLTEIIKIYEEMIFTEDESLVVGALQLIDPTIQKVSPKGENMVVKKEGYNKPIMLGSFGEGIWRLLSLILGLVKSKDGTFIVDEIDMGLHHTIMEKMWDLILRTAEKLNVQVFASTHSNDCIQSLASVIAEQPNQNHESVSIQRIESGKTKSVSYSEKEIMAAAKNDIEVR